MKHEWDLKTNFCMKCGRAKLDDCNEPKLLCSSENVIPVSHIISERRLNGMFAGMRQ